jgi:pilus assembly protein CpaB
MAISLNRSWIVLGGALVFGALAVFASSRYISTTLSKEKARLTPDVEQIDVVVAKADLERGMLVDSETMAVRKVPAEFVPGSAVTPEEFGNFEGAKLALEMRAGEVLLRGTLEGADTATFATKVARGVRAMTLQVDEVNSLSGLLQPGDRVDLFFTARPQPDAQGRQPREQTALLMQNVDVLATGRQVRPSITDGGTPGIGRAFSTITIETNARDAQRLILAQKAGSITAVLRGPDDKEPLTAATIDAGALFGEVPKTRAPRLARNAGPRVEVIIGGSGRMAREMIPVAAAPATGAVPPVVSTSAPEVTASVQAQSAQLLRAIAEAARPPSEAPTMSSR